MMLLLFKFLWTIDALASLAVLYFFLADLRDGAIAGRNMNIWFIIIAVLTGIMLGSSWLKNHDYSMTAVLLLLVLAIPVLVYAIYILFALPGKQRWNQNNF